MLTNSAGLGARFNADSCFVCHSQPHLARQSATADLRASLGIGGVPNRSPNDGTIARFGWKAQDKSIQLFAAEAHNVEMGASPKLPTKRRNATDR